MGSVVSKEAEPRELVKDSVPGLTITHGLKILLRVGPGPLCYTKPLSCDTLTLNKLSYTDGLWWICLFK